MDTVLQTITGGIMETENTQTQETNVNEEVNINSPEKEGQKFFSQDEINVLISNRLERERKKHQEELEKEKKLSLMTAEEKLRANKEEQEARIAEYIKKAETLERKQIAQESLREFGLDSRFADFVVDADREILMANIKLLKGLIDSQVRGKVKESLQGETPQHIAQQCAQSPQGNSPQMKTKMSLADMQEMYRKDPEAFRKQYNK